MSNIKLNLTGLSLQDALLMLRSVLGIETTAALVLSWLCSKEKHGVVLVKAQEYQKELKMKPQHFSNTLRALKDAGLITGERGTYTISEKVPKVKPITYTIKID
jgi:DNA-binding MarR family transcriptional regulator